MVIKRIAFLLINVVLDIVFLLLTGYFYFLTYLLPAIDIFLVIVIFKRDDNCNKGLITVTLAIILTAIQLITTKMIGDAGAFALTFLLTIFFTTVPLFLSSMFFFGRDK